MMPEKDPVALVYSPGLLSYDFGPRHPLRPERITVGLDLLAALHIWDAPRETMQANPASDETLLLIHGADYIEAVRTAERGTLAANERARFGLSSSDNPPFPNMHLAASMVAGGAADAAWAVMNGTRTHVFHPAGGLHHAQQSRASGFCIYNDPAAAAAVAASYFGARVAYIDFDCHHGDGVQWLFYDDPGVLTVSFHESGRYLFPGTGDVDECGEGDGRGFAVNVPFLPYTQNGSWLDAVHAVLPPLLERFRPDLLITVHGCDTHLWDPLTHLALSTDAFYEQARISHELAHVYSEGRWIAFGSGGYDWRRVVPRSWAIVWSEMSGRPLPNELPISWLDRWRDDNGEKLPTHFADRFTSTLTPDGEIERVNRATVARVLANLST